MFSWKRDSADISEDEPIFRVRYLGHTDTLIATGTGCAIAPLRRLWARRDAKKLRKVTVQISTRGVFMYDVDKKSKSYSTKSTKSRNNNNNSKDGASGITRRRSDDDILPSSSSSSSSYIECPRYFPMEDISYCAASDESVDDRLFCWIYRRSCESTLEMEVHAVVCSGKEKAQTMAAVLSRAFRHAYTHWKSAHRVTQGRRNEEIDGAQIDPACVGLSFNSKGGNPLSQFKLEKGSQRVSCSSKKK